MHYINCKVITLAELKKANRPEDSVLISNMEGNNWDRMAQTVSGWRWCQPICKGDTVV